MQTDEAKDKLGTATAPYLRSAEFQVFEPDADLTLVEPAFPRRDYRGLLQSGAIPSRVAARITTSPTLPPFNVQWYWDSGGKEFINADHWATIIYDDHGRNDRSQRIHSVLPTLLATYDFSNQILGGRLELECRANWRDRRTGETGSSPVGRGSDWSIRGDNPSKSAVKTALREVRLQVIAYMESRFRQFDVTGLPLFGPPNGFGIMQIDNPPATARQVWDWRSNVAAGVALIARKTQEVQNHFRNIYRANPDAPHLTEEQLSLSIYQYYNGGWYWSWNSRRKMWEKRGVTSYGDEGLRIEMLVASGQYPPGWN